MTPHQVLKKYWGYDEFRPLQLDIIQSVIEGNDTLALLPTGGGKSICFQVPAVCRGGICIVISPLIALMKDQVHNLRKHGLNAYAIFSGMTLKDIDRILDNCVHGNVQFLYLSPERLHTELAKERIKQMNVGLVAIDEAHCISQWGYDFRPSYLNIAEMREWLPNVPFIALTATATNDVVEDIQEKLAFLPNKKVFRKSFVRDNLAYVVLHEENKNGKLLEILKNVQGSGVVYVMNRKQTKEIALFLHKNGISSGFYHAGLSTDYRSKMQDEWIKGKLRIMVATNAFGMGIDKPDVRVVVHMTLPDNLEGYFQEAGRGGRDGKKAYAVLLYNQEDRKRLLQQYEQSYPPLQEIRQVYQALGSYFQLALGAGMGQTFDFDLADFSRRYNLSPLMVLHALKMLTRDSYISVSENLYLPPSMQIIVDKSDLYDYMLRNKKLEKLVKAILRNAQGAFNYPVKIKEAQLANFLRITRIELMHALKKLHQDKIIRYRPQKDVPQLTFLTERLHAQDLTFDLNLRNFLKSRHEFRMQEALYYAENVQCRSQMLIAYFGEQDPPTCGQCDVCLGRHEKLRTKEEYQYIHNKTKEVLCQHPLTLPQLVQKFPNVWEKKALQAIQQMLDNGFISQNDEQKLFWKR